MQEVVCNTFSSSQEYSNLKCAIHKYKYNQLYLEQSGQNSIPLKCTKCEPTQRLDPLKILTIEDIFKSTNDTIFDNWPLFGHTNSPFQKINELTPLNYEGIRTFFKGIRSTFAEQMDRIESKVISQYEIIDSNKKLMISYYNSVSQKDNIMKSITELSSNPQKSIDELTKIIEEVNTKRPRIQSDINHCYKSLKYYQDYLSVDNLQTFSESIKQIGDILEKVVNYEIFNLFETKDNKVVALEQNEKFDKEVYGCHLLKSYSVSKIRYDHSQQIQKDQCSTSSYAKDINNFDFYANYYQTKYNNSLLK